MKKICFIVFVSICCSLNLGQDNINHKYKIIPIDYRGHIYIDGSVNDVKDHFIVDTGADNLYFDSLFYAQSNLKYDSIITARVPGAGKELQKVKVILDPVRFDFHDLNYRTQLVPVISLKPIVGDFADGIIGSDYFSKKILEINYARNYMKIHDEIDSLILGGYTKIQYQKIKNRLYLPATLTINDTLSITELFMIDLGCAGTIALTSPAASKYNLNQVIADKARYYTKYRGVGGESESYAFVTTSIDIGGYILKHFEAEYSTDRSGSLSSAINAGLLGNKILDRFDVMIDFKTHCLYIKPNGTFSNDFKFSKLGFSLVDRSQTLGVWVVSGFYAKHNRINNYNYACFS